MKKAVLLLGLFFTSFAFAQEKEAKNGVENFVPDVSALPDYNIVKSKLDLKQVVTKADTIPEFPGGMIAFKKKYFENIETLDLKNNEKVDIRLYFIVEKNGYIRNVAAVSKNKKHAEEAELGVKRMFIRWKPAKLNGQAVRYLFYFPLKSKKYN
ncbi:energy transducer TonB [Chryseobacterium sp. 2R14A]|uniref:energy transducer TonB n=1 Tax=Chryseobacterium sp. 2R14A TaxID=3380353 RepID=UPI003CE92A9A